MNVVQAATKLSDILGISSRTMLHMARRLGEAGLLPRGPRGVNAPDVSPVDAGRLVVAALTLADGATFVASRAVQLVESVGLLWSESPTPGFRGRGKQFELAPPGSFLHAVTHIMTMLSGFDHRPLNSIWTPDFEEIGVSSIRSTKLAWIKQRRFVYHDPVYHDDDKPNPTMAIERYWFTTDGINPGEVDPIGSQSGLQRIGVIAMPTLREFAAALRWA